MSLFKRLIGNNYSNTKWEDTEEGKRFYEKALLNAKKRIIAKEEWERNTPPERKEQVKLFKIFFTFFLLTYFAFLFTGFRKGIELYVLLAEGSLTLVSFIFYKIKPKKIKYPNCFMMPVIAFGCIILLYIMLGFDYGFNPNRNKGKNEPNNETDTMQEREGYLSESEFYENDYSKWLEENEFETSEEIKKDFEKYRS